MGQLTMQLIFTQDSFVDLLIGIVIGLVKSQSAKMTSSKWMEHCVQEQTPFDTHTFLSCLLKALEQI